MTELPKMAELPSASFPVVFFDGDRDVDVGSVVVIPSLDFAKFQSLIAQKIGVSPLQISISLVRRKKARSSPEIRRKVPIDVSSDFSAIAAERDCFILAVIRRSRSGRRSRGRRGRGSSGGSGDEKKGIEVPEMKILRRNQEERIPIGSLGFWDYEAQVRNLQRMREKYLLSTAAAYYPYAPSPPLGRVGGHVTPPVCVVCIEAKAEGRSPGFHWCVYDKITVGFRSPAGPIERPVKKNAEVFA